MNPTLDQPRFSVQLNLLHDDEVTLVCDVCHGHTVLSRSQVNRLIPDRIGCYQCGAVNDLPNKEMLA